MAGRKSKLSPGAAVWPGHASGGSQYDRLEAPAHLIYEELNHLDDKIRLLQITHQHLPGYSRNDRSISFKLHTVPLENAPAYYALSYHWGESSGHDFIYLNGYQKGITKNLAIALRQLHHFAAQNEKLDSRAFIWIDALCINQQNSQERNHQVAKMRSIYSKAEGVFISLGEAAEDSHLVPSLATALVAWEDSNKESVEQIMNAREIQAFCAFQSLITRTYWTRIWVVQEVNLAKRAEILFGEDSLAWETLLRAQNILNSNQSALWKIVNIEPRLSTFTSDVWYEGPRGLLSHIGDHEPSLFEALRWHCTKESTLPEDKVYAILGITTARDDPAMAVDYSRGVEQLYIDTTKYIIQSTQRLDVICGMQHSHQKSSIKLPSWVVNWVDAYTSCLLDGSAGEVHATESKGTSFQFSDDGKGLMVEAIYLGTITSVAEYPASDDEETLEACRLSCLDKFYLSSLMFGNPEEATISDLLRLCESFTCGRILRDIECLIELGNAEATRMILAIFAYLASKEEPMFLGQTMIDLAQELTGKFSEEDLDSWGSIILSDLETVLHSRRSFLCKDGLVGSGFGQSEPGCEVFAIVGCYSPVILKPTKVNVDGLESFEVVGDSYVQGYMQGQALVELREQKRTLQKIILV